MQKHAKQPAQIAAVLSLDNASERDVMRGVQRFMREHTEAEFAGFVDARSQDVREQLDALRPDGIVTHLYVYMAYAAVRRRGVPVVDTAYVSSEERRMLARVAPDDLAIGDEAARHLVQCGFQRFAYCGQPTVPSSVLRLRGFRNALEQAGFGLDSELSIQPSPYGWSVALRAETVDPWIAGLPDGTAVFCYSDLGARQIGDACTRQRRVVPDELAILGVDNDELQCCSGPVTLSSIDPGNARVGYEACRALLRMLEGEPARSVHRTLAPIGVVTRATTDILVCRDPVVHRALVYMRDRLTEPLKIEDVAAHAHVSRRALEVAFQHELHCPPYEMVLRLRVARARSLLVESDAELAVIAERCGFCDEQHFSRIFRSKCGTSPGRYRRERRSG